MRARLFNWKMGSWLVALVLIGAVGALGVTALSGTGTSQPAEKAQRGTTYAESLSYAFRDASERTLPAVVMIRTMPVVAKTSESGEPEIDDRFEGTPFGDLEDSPFGDMFKQHPELRRFFREMPSRPSVPRFTPQGMGSGVIIDGDGVILTNNHVVRGGGKILVRLHDGREFDAVEVKTDPKTDLAIVRIEAEELKAAPLGDSDKARVGDWVLALGQPFGLEGTVTAGIISAKGRGLGITARENFIQTDAAINPGNSGGPLVNLDGEVVGINTAISSRSGGNQGVGFAVPVNLAKWVASQLQQDGKVRRAYLGVAIQPVNQQLADQFGVEVNSGVVVSDVFDETPGAAAGLKAGDVIVSFGGTMVTQPRELQNVVERAPIGSTQTMTVIREGKQKKLKVELKEQPEDYGLRHGRSTVPGGKSEPQSGHFEGLGLEVEELTPEVADQLDLDGAEGVVITKVLRNGPAALAGLESGMVIVQANRKAVESIADLENAVKSSSADKGVLLLVRSAQGSRFVVLKKSTE